MAVGEAEGGRASRGDGWGWYQCRNVEKVDLLVGAGQTTVRWSLRKVGVDTSPRRMTDADFGEVGRLADEGMSCRQIGAQWTGHTGR